VILVLHYYLLGSTMLGGMVIGAAWFGLFLLTVISYYADLRSTRLESPGRRLPAWFAPGDTSPPTVAWGGGSGA
jgi:hypothetical protein